MMTSEQLFAAPKLVRRAKGRLDRGMEAVSAARTRATEIAQQCAELPRLVPTNASQRRRFEVEIGRVVKPAAPTMNQRNAGH